MNFDLAILLLTAGFQHLEGTGANSMDFAAGGNPGIGMGQGLGSTTVTTISSQASRNPTTERAFNASLNLNSTTDNMITTTSSLKTIITPSTTIISHQYQTSSDETTTLKQKSQGYKDQYGILGNTKSSEGVIGNTAMIAGVTSAAGVAVLALLLVFVLKSICIAAKVSPKPNGLFGNPQDDFVQDENKRNTKLTTHV